MPGIYFKGRGIQGAARGRNKRRRMASPTTFGTGNDMKRMVFALALAALAFLNASIPALAVEPVKRPTIGLALGGGGVRGVAHIGVLRVLEREKIPIDFIAGTSMGAIIGGFYSAGLSL